MMSYNGYTNYETWAVQLWIDNNESSSSYWRQVAAETYYHQAIEGVHFSKVEDAICLLTEKLKDSYNNQMETVLSESNTSGTVWADLLNASVCAVNFGEIAKNIMESIYLISDIEVGA
jgi:hypothetical protein